MCRGSGAAQADLQLGYGARAKGWVRPFHFFSVSIHASTLSASFHREMRSYLANRELPVLPGTGNNIQRLLVLKETQ